MFFELPVQIKFLLFFRYLADGNFSTSQYFIA